MKKLAIITTHPIQYQVPLFKNLSKKNIDTHVFFASKHGLKPVNIDPEFLIKFKWDINSNILLGYKSYFPKIQKSKINEFLLSFKGIENFIKKEKFDAILILGWSNMHYLKAFYFALKYKIKIILRAENNLHSKNSIIKRFIKKILLKVIFKKISYFLSIGKLNREFYLYHGIKEKKIYNSPYFVDNNFFNIKDRKKKLKKKLNLNYKNIILFVGKFVDRKRPFDFLELARINKENKNLLFLMIGDGLLKKKCTKFAKQNKLDNLFIKGFVNQNELRKYYKISDVLVQTSSYETWGLTINEAMASGIPVICTKDCGAYTDLIKENKSGLGYNAGNIKQLNFKINSLLINKFRFKKSNIKKIISEYTINKTINSIEKILYAKKK